VTTIYDVAKAAGVTAATVSYVLSGKRPVSKATRERVMRYIQELGYRPNQIARSLIKQRTKTIGLVVPYIGNPFYAEMAEAAERITYAAGFRIFVTNTYRDEHLAQGLLDDLLSRHVDGIIIASEMPSLAEEALQSLNATSETPLPLVLCLWEGNEPDFAPAVKFDFLTGAQLAAEHLLDLGHRRIGVVVDAISSDGVTLEKVHHFARLDGFQEALTHRGYPLDQSLLGIGNSSLESGKQAAYHLLQLYSPPTAIFATNDLMALGVMSAAWELGIHVPHQLSVVGFDDIAIAAYYTPPLTTVIMRSSTVVEQALDLLFCMIEGKQVISPPILQPTLVVRGSTAPPDVKRSHSVDD
jgi:DNA-binding LacI/PurR family transcriptional regulator